MTGKQIGKQRKKIEFEVPHHTIYNDIVDMPDPLLLGTTIHYHNYSDGTLYMQIVGAGTGWSGSTVNLGSLGSGLDAYQNLDNFMSRTKPVAAVTETVTLTLKGYSDAGYSTLVYSFSRNVTVVFIKSDDGTWATDFSDNFDDGLVDGWAGQLIYDSSTGALTTFAVATDFVLSVPNSLKGTQNGNNDLQYQIRFYKSFAIPNKTTVYAIIHVRASWSVDNANMHIRLKRSRINEDTTTLLTIGETPDTADTDYIPVDKWMRIVVPLTPNGTRQMNIYLDFYGWHTGPVGLYTGKLWFDDFKIISK